MEPVASTTKARSSLAGLRQDRLVDRILAPSLNGLSAGMLKRSLPYSTLAVSWGAADVSVAHMPYHSSALTVLSVVVSQTCPLPSLIFTWALQRGIPALLFTNTVYRASGRKGHV